MFESEAEYMNFIIDDITLLFVKNYIFNKYDLLSNDKFSIRVYSDYLYLYQESGSK